MAEAVLHNLENVLGYSATTPPISGFLLLLRWLIGSADELLDGNITLDIGGGGDPSPQ